MDAKFYAANRQRFFDDMTDGSVLLLFSGEAIQQSADSYYPFLSTKMRVNVFVGQRVELTLPSNRRKFVKSITAFYELSTCDLYIRALVQDSHVRLTDIFGLSLGLKFQIF